MGITTLMISDSNAGSLDIAAMDCALALGRLAGTLRYAGSDIGAHFALRTVRRTIIGALHSVGYLDTEWCFDAWLSRAGPPPDGTRPGLPPPGLIVRLVLEELKNASWEPLRHAAALAARAAPHLSVVEDVSDRATLEEEARMALAEARRMVAAEPLPGHGFPALFALTEEIARSPRFAPTEPAVITFNTPNGSRAAKSNRATNHGWAIGLLMGEAFKACGLLPFAIPLITSVTPDTLRADRAASARKAAFVRRLSGAVDAALADMDRSSLLSGHAAQSLAHHRTNSRAGSVYRLIAALGPLRSTQILHAFALTRRGARLLLDGLADQGLLTATGAGGAWVADDPHAPVGPSPSSERPSPALFAEFDRAMAALDALLPELPPSDSEPSSE